MAAQPSIDFELNVQDNTKRALRSFNQNLKNTARTLQVFQGPLGPIAGRFTALSTALNTLNPLMLGGVAALTSFGLAASKAITQFQATESQLNQLNAQIERTGFTAGKTAQDLEDLAQAVAQETLASLQQVREAEGILISFRNVSGEAFDRALRASQDLAQAGFGSMRTAAIQLGKALEDPENGLDGLARAGTKFTERQKEIIRGLVETGNQAEALNQILTEVENQIGGAGAGAAQGLAGQFDSLAQAVENFWAALGKSLTGRAFGATIDFITSSIQKLTRALGDFEDQTTQNLQKELEQLRGELSRTSRVKQPGRVRQLEQEILQIEAIIGRREIESRIAEVKGQREREINAELERQDKLRKQLLEDQDEFNKLQEKLIPADKIYREYKEAQDLIERFSTGQRQDLLSQANLDAYNKAMDGLNKKTKETKAEVREIWGLWKDIGDTVSDSFTNALLEAQKLSDVVRSLFADIARMVVQQTVGQMVSGLVTSGLVGMFGRENPQAGFTGTQIHQRATGGPASGLTMVGEYGPELVSLPKGSRVIPNRHLGGGSQITVNNYASESVQADVETQPDGSVMVNVIEQTVAKSMNTRGQVYKTMQNSFGTRQRPVTR